MAAGRLLLFDFPYQGDQLNDHCGKQTDVCKTQCQHSLTPFQKAGGEKEGFTPYVKEG